MLLGLTLAVFARGLRGPAVAVTIIDDVVVHSLAGLVGPGLEPALRGLARIASWWVLYTSYFALFAALLVLRRWRHLLVWWVAVQLGSLVTVALMTILGGHGRSGWTCGPAGADGRCPRCRSPF